jgi:lysophospholipase L1-like esterase
MKKIKYLIIALVALLFVGTIGFANSGENRNLLTADTVKKQERAENWVTSWNASQEPIWGSDFVLPKKIPDKMKNQTIRQTARISIGGNRVRVVFSNEYGKNPLKIGESHVALTDSGVKIIQGSDKKLTFDGKTSVVIPAGETITSDPINLKVNSLAKVTVSLFLPEETELTTFHWDSRQTNYIASENVTSATSFQADSTIDASMFLSGILVDSPKNKGTVVAIGDSITDGNGAKVDANTRWPDYLANRLVSQGFSVINAGISGNRLLKDGMGVSVLSRFNRDVLSQPNVKSVIVMIGINDISWPGTGFAPTETRPTFDELVAGYRQLIARAHAHHIKVIGVTLTPFEGALSGTNLDNYYSKDKDELRQKVNNWIRSGEFDSVVDLDAILKDPEHPTRLLAK